MSACGKKTSGPLGLGVSTCVRASWHDGECRPWLTSDERDEAELATLRADLARVKAERDGLADGLTIANNAAERRGRERDAACAQVRELQRVARAAVALRKTGKRAIDDPRGVLEEHAIDAVVDVFRAVDALPPSMLEEPSDARRVHVCPRGVRHDRPRREVPVTIDTEKLRALSRSCEYVVKATEAGDVSELWAVRFDVMGRPYNSRIGVTSHGVAALVAAAVNTLPELLDAAEDLALWNASPFARLVDLLADAKTENFAATDFQHARSDSTQERWILSAQRAEGKTLADRCVELNAALATAEAERLTLARALLESAPAALDGDPDAYFERRDAANDLAARIVAEADAASKEVRRG